METLNILELILSFIFVLISALMSVYLSNINKRYVTYNNFIYALKKGWITKPEHYQEFLDSFYSSYLYKKTESNPYVKNIIAVRNYRGKLTDLDEIEKRYVNNTEEIKKYIECVFEKLSAKYYDFNNNKISEDEFLKFFNSGMKFFCGKEEDKDTAKKDLNNSEWWALCNGKKADIDTVKKDVDCFLKDKRVEHIYNEKNNEILNIVEEYKNNVIFTNELDIYPKNKGMEKLLFSKMIDELKELHSQTEEAKNECQKYREKITDKETKYWVAFIWIDLKTSCFLQPFLKTYV